MNIIEIYNKNHDTVFITRSCKKAKVDSFDTGAYPVKMKLLETGGCFHVTNGGNYLNDYDYHELDIVDYEREKHTAFTVGEYVTSDGRKATIYHDLSERFKMCYPLFGYIDGNEVHGTWTKCGESIMGETTPYDLVGPWVEPQRTITVNGKEFYPVKNPKDGKRHFYVSVATQTVAHSTTWNVKNPNILDAMLVNLNLVYRTGEEAQAFLDEITKPNAEIKINE
ncbi:TPA: hypothetical protein QB326_001560 [Pasteurella multocida]|nr:hypothetical protein [Pasteurella multocida]